MEFSEWSIFYPIYFDSTRKSCQGRRVPKAIGVPQPTAVDIHQAAQQLSLACHIESEKRHPKEPFVYGRVRIQLPENTTKDQLLRKLCQVLPDIVKNNKSKQKAAAQPAQASSSSSSKATTTGPQLVARKKKK
jgi:signal recognition particle subunit SRP19